MKLLIYFNFFKSKTPDCKLCQVKAEGHIDTIFIYKNDV